MIDYILLEKYCMNLKVLFVEDDKNIQKEVSELLHDIFSHVDIASDGKEGLEKYLEFYKEKKSYYDIVITDIKMPNMDGVELTRRVYEINKEQKLIVLSAYSESKYLLQLVNIGISQFIEKPLEFESFIHVIFSITKDIYNNNTSSNEEDFTIVEVNENILWNKKTSQLLVSNQNFKLTKKETILLELLFKNPETTHTIEEILTIVWEDEVCDINNLKNLISRLRKKVPELHIENIYGFGYRISLK